MSTYLISGASRGIGRDLCRHLLGDGHRVLALSRNAEELSTLAKEAKEEGGDFHFFPFDLAAKDWNPFLKWVRSFGPLNGVVNNAGLLVKDRFEEISAADWEKVFAVNLFGPVRLCRELSPQLTEGGHVVNIGSMAGYQGSSKFAGLSAYGAAKGALATFTESLAEEWKDRSISVNCLALGAVNTEMLAAAFPGYSAPVDSDEMGGFIGWFLVEAGRFFNGKVLPVALNNP